MGWQPTEEQLEEFEDEMHRRRPARVRCFGGLGTRVLEAMDWEAYRRGMPLGTHDCPALKAKLALDATPSHWMAL